MTASKGWDPMSEDLEQRKRDLVAKHARTWPKSLTSQALMRGLDALASEALTLVSSAPPRSSLRRADGETASVHCRKCGEGISTCWNCDTPIPEFTAVLPSWHAKKDEAMQVMRALARGERGPLTAEEARWIANIIEDAD